MGTKIYNGYKLPLMSLKELTEFTIRFRKLAEQKAGEMASIFLANELAEMLDDLKVLDTEPYIIRHMLYETEQEKLREQRKLESRGVVFDEKEKVKLILEGYTYRSAYMLAFRKADQRYRKIQVTQQRDPEVDFDCNACFIPMEDKILALFYTEQKELRELWESCEEVISYGYWSGDPEEGLTEEEWDARRDEWDKALPGVGIPMENGLVADFTKGFPSMRESSPKDTLRHMPTLEKRARRVAFERVQDRKFSEIKAGLPPEKQEDALNIYHETRRWMRTDDAKEAVQVEVETIRPLLIPELKKTHLLTHLHKVAIGEFDDLSDEENDEQETG